MNNDQLLEKIEEFINPLVSGFAHLKTAVEALKAGQDDLLEKVVRLEEKVVKLEERVVRLEEKVVKLETGQLLIEKKIDHLEQGQKRIEHTLDKTLYNHEERIKQLEEDQLSSHKN